MAGNGIPPKGPECAAVPCVPSYARESCAKGAERDLPPSLKGFWALGHSSQSESVLRTNGFASSGEIRAGRTSAKGRTTKSKKASH